jgi:adenylate kinase family enzyme
VKVRCKVKFTELSEHNKIVILGYPRSGKTTISDEMQLDPAFTEYAFFHADDVFDEGLDNEQSLLTLVAALIDVEKYVAEGCLCFRLLRKIEELHLDELRPSCIVFVQGKILERYERFVKGLSKIWGDFVKLADKNGSYFKYVEVK